MTKKKSIILISLSVLLMICITVGMSYSYFQKTKKQTITNVAATSCLDINLTGNNEIDLQNEFPISDEEGMELVPYTFTITNTCTSPIQYDVVLESLAGTTLQNTSVQVALGNSNKMYSNYETVETTLTDSKEARRLTTGVLTAENNSKTYELRLWIDKDAPLSEQNKSFATKIMINGTLAQQVNISSDENESGSGSTGGPSTMYAYTEPTLNGADPVLSSGLVPVTIADNGTVRKADLTEEWYRYQNKEWANAVILNDSYTELVGSNKLYGATKQSDGELLLDGTDDYIDIGLESYDFTKELTIGARVKLNELKEQTILSNGNISLKMNASNKIVFEVIGESGTVYQAIAANNIDTTTIYSIVGTYDGTNIKLYINGELLYTKASSENIKVSTNSFLIGKEDTTYASMKVYETLIVNNCEPAIEIERYYTEAFRINAKKVVNYQKFENSAITTDEVIPENNIESYFVWIPRYRYKIFHPTAGVSKLNTSPTLPNTITNKAQTIEIEFESKSKAASTGSTYNTWLTHPAFTSFNTNGLWINKFEPTGTIDKVECKPNEATILNQTVSAYWNAAYNYKRSMDSHMMKNTEWGALLYLSNSKYGIDKVMNLNNNADRLTGYSTAVTQTAAGIYGTTEDVTLPYNTKVGYQASTTGNITGVYDMNGNSGEYAAAYLKGYLGESGFTSDPATTYGSKYFDVYIWDSDNAWDDTNRRILGDATGELGPLYKSTTTYITKSSWYGSEMYLVHPGGGWSVRGTAYLSGNETQFWTQAIPGQGSDWYSFRIVLANDGS
ncbi:MAG: LamG domain-containing protein [Bacilli bacterium]